MDRRLEYGFVALVAVQALHSFEEYATGFYRVFPPAVALGRVLPGVVKPGFITFNLLLFAAGVCCWLLLVRPGRHGAMAAIWAWLLIEAFNSVVHPAWSLIARAYRPGLVTALFFPPIVIYLFLVLRPRSLAQEAAVRR